MIPEKSRGKMQVVNKGEEKLLLKEISPDQLPLEYGGLAQDFNTFW